MSYLYGDSTPSPLEINFVDFLGDCFDFCAHVLTSNETMRREGENGDALRRAAQADTLRLEKLVSAVSLAAKEVSTGHGDDHTASCAVAIVRATSDLVRTEIEQVRSTLESELAKLDVLSLRERESCEKALGTLLLRHDLPRTQKSMSLKAHGSGPYVARLRMSTPFGVVATVDLDVPSENLYSHVFRVDRIVERLEVEAPDVGGWLHKEVKMRAQRLDKLHVILVEFAGVESSVRLRAGADGSGPGFDMLVRSEGPQVSLLRVGNRDGAVEAPFDVQGQDAINLQTFLHKLEAPARGLLGHRKALVEATLDDRPLRDHAGPSVLVERLIAAMAPVTKEIARRSGSSTELVLKRLVGGGRREEIFATKAELLMKIAHLPPAHRALFDPLGLGQGNGSVGASSRPVPSASSQSLEAQGADPTTLVMAPKRATKPAGTGEQVNVRSDENPIDPNAPKPA